MVEGAQQNGIILSSNSTPLRIPILVYASFGLTGVVTTLLGPILPVLSSKWSLSDAQSGYLFTAQFIGSLGGVAVSSSFMGRWGFQRTLALSFAMMAIGVAALGPAVWAVGLAAVFCYGIGLGLNIPTTNMLVAEANPARPAAALNILNMAWGFGAVACPAMVALMVLWRITGPGLAGLATLLGTTALGLAHYPLARDSSRKEEVAALKGKALWKSPWLPLLGGMFFLYVGTENGVSGWVASYARRLSSQPGTAWALAPMFFWAALLIGRALAPFVLRYTADAKLMLAGLLAASLGVSVLLLAQTQAGVFWGASLAGLGLSSVFPLTIAMLPHCFGAAATRVAGPMFALGSLGGATLPWVVGFLSTQFGSLRAGLAVPMAGTLIMAASFLKLHFEVHDLNTGRDQDSTH